LSVLALRFGHDARQVAADETLVWKSLHICTRLVAPRKVTRIDFATSSVMFTDFQECAPFTLLEEAWRWLFEIDVCDVSVSGRGR